MAYDFKFPDVGEGITEGELVEWLIKVGDIVKEHQAIAKVETDKAVVDVPSPKAGTILKLNAKEGETIKVGQVIAVIGEKGEKVTTIKETKKEEKVLEKKQTNTTSVVGQLEESDEEFIVEEKKEVKDKKKILATPNIRKLAKELNVNLENIEGTGKGGRITEQDLKKVSKGEVPTETTDEGKIKVTKKYDMYGYIDRIPLKGIRKTIAQNMVRSNTEIAAVTSMDDVDVTELSKLRDKEKKNAEKLKVKLTFLPFIVKAVIAGLKAYPVLNSILQENEILIKKYFNIGIAVDSDNGLFVPVLKGADKKNILDISKEIFSLADKVRQRKIDLGDLKGGTFTITNYGSIGGTYGTPIINYPEAAILGVGRIKEFPLYKDGEVKIRKVLPLSLTFDHRILDGAIAARFMNEVKKHLEDPRLMFIEG
tara:strand:+ start:57940 stop:59211 length:1272 start_codon:yes stop_codon:yes gene_type:complete